MPPKKSKLRGSAGVQLQNMSATDEEPTSPLAEVPVERPIPKETTSQKKLTISTHCSLSSFSSMELRSRSQPSTSSTVTGESCEYSEKLQGYRLISCERLPKQLVRLVYVLPVDLPSPSKRVWNVGGGWCRGCRSVVPSMQQGGFCH